ncbi:MAG: FAD-dependent oxidoreductase [Burkholderiales bacterium]|nr:FAD-dependent oxidoreductase [Burkholderiales bacterium]
MAIETQVADVVVAGCGIGGLSAAVSALEEGASVAILERAPAEERGGNTRYTEAYLRMKSDTEVCDDFEAHFAANSGGYLDPALIDATKQPYADWPSIVKALSFADPEVVSAFASGCGPAVQWLKGFGVRFDFLPTQFLTKAQPRLLPIGGGLALLEALAERAERLKASFFYRTSAHSLLQDDSGAVIGLRAVAADHRPIDFRAKAVVLATGGFEGNWEMLAQYMGAHAVHLRPVARGGYYNKGEGIRMALQIGAAPAGDYASFHAEPVDPRSGVPEASVFIFPYGVLVNRRGERFIDEASGTVDAVYDTITKAIWQQPGGIAYAVFDARLQDVPNYRIGLRTDQPPIAADTLAELESKLGLPRTRLEASIARYNECCRPGRFEPLALDRLATKVLDPPKSNWARPLDRPPFQAWPVMASCVLTYGGLKVDARARVLNADGEVIPGLYAAGEVVGLYYKVYTGATSVLKGAVFGRYAGIDAAARRRG